MSEQSINIILLPTLFSAFYSSVFIIFELIYPFYLLNMGLMYHEIGLIISVGFVISILMALITGELLSRINIRIILFFCFIFLTFSSIILVLFPERLYILYTMRLIQGATRAIFSVTIFTYVAKITETSHIGRGMGLVSAAFALGNVLGPTIGFYVSQFIGYFWVLVLSSIIPLILSPLSFIYNNAICKPSIGKGRNLKTILFDYRKVALKIKWFSILSIIEYIILSIWITFLPIFLVNKFGHPETLIGLLITIESLSYVLSQYLVGKIIDKSGVKFAFPLITFYGILFLLISLLGKNVFFLIIGLIFIGLFSSPISIARLSLIGKMKNINVGLALGILDASSYIGFFLGPAIAGFISIKSCLDNIFLFLMPTLGILGLIPSYHALFDQ